MIRNRFFTVVNVMLLLEVAIIFSGCNKTTDQDPLDHPELCDSILSRAAQLPTQKQISFINQAYAKFNPGPEDRWKRYGFIRNYHFTEREYPRPPLTLIA